MINYTMNDSLVVSKTPQVLSNSTTSPHSSGLHTHRSVFPDQICLYGRIKTPPLGDPSGCFSHQHIETDK